MNELQNILISKIGIKSNQRKTYVENSLKELAQSIKEEGVIQPILVMETDNIDKFIVVAGHRRLEAAKMANLKMIPCKVKPPLSDEEFNTLQMLENLQRENVQPWDEADAFKELSKTLTVGEISQRIGKNATYISLRIELSSISDYWMDIFKLGKMTMNTALQIARLPRVAQDKLQVLLSSGAILTDENVNSWIKNRIMLNLVDAKFPLETPFAGCIACINCKERTGGNAFLFPEISGSDYCLNASCFDIKKTEHTKQILSKVYDQYPDILKITGDYKDLKLSDTEVALGYNRYHNIDESRAEEEGVLRAVYVAGQHVGRIVYVKLKEISAERLAIEPVLDKKEKAKQNKVIAEAKELATEAIISTFNSSNLRLLDYHLAKSIINGIASFWNAADQVAYLIAKFNFTEFTKYDSLPERFNWISENLSTLSPGDKINVFIGHHTEKARKQGDSEIFKLAQFVGIDTTEEQFLDMASEKIELAKSTGIVTEEKAVKEKVVKPKVKKEKQVKAVESESNQSEKENEAVSSISDLIGKMEDDLEESGKSIVPAQDLEELYEGDDLETMDSDILNEEENFDKDEHEDAGSLPRFGHDKDF